MTWDEIVVTISAGQADFRISVADITVFSLTFLLMAFGGLAIARALHARRAGCRWKRARGQAKPSFVKWRCGRCGEEAFSADANPPRDARET